MVYSLLWVLQSTTSNPHVAEERNVQVDDSGLNEEDKSVCAPEGHPTHSLILSPPVMIRYGAVVRSANAYVPPGARRTSSGTPISPPATALIKEKDAEKPDVPKVSVNAPDGSEKTLPGKATSPPAGGVTTKAPADALPAFRDFVTNEKQRLTQKRQALVKNEMDKRMAELVKFSQSFKVFCHPGSYWRSQSNLID